MEISYLAEGPIEICYLGIGGDQHSPSSAGNHSRGLSRGLRRHGKEWRKDQGHMHEEQVGGQDSREGSSRGYRSASYIPEQELHERKEQEMECPCSQVRKLELEIRGRHQRRNLQ